MAGLENGPNLHSEWLTALVALVSPNAGALALHRADAIHAAAMGADRAFWPYTHFDPFVGRRLVVEVLI
jgi:hypothetical protein